VLKGRGYTNIANGSKPNKVYRAYDGSPNYFSSTERVRKRWNKTNLVKDVRAADVVLWE
jgi:hypothetical protein